MRTARHSQMTYRMKVIFLLSVMGAALSLFSCGHHGTEERYLGPPTVLSIDDRIVVLPQEFFPSSEAQIRASCPNEVSLFPRIYAAPSGRGFLLSFTWSFSGAAPRDWEIHRYYDHDDGEDELYYQGLETFRKGTRLEYRSEEMQRNRLYKYELICNASPPVHGMVKFRTITVNLRGL